ncbi:MAG: hypothetical protein ACI808_000821 [Paraglaciecola sp.]|jgi:hypothetical protein
MSYRVPHRVKKLSKLRSIIAVAGLASISVHSSFIHAADDWWFDVEVIVFKRNVSLDEIGEKFPLATPSAPSAENEDLLTAYLHPDLSHLINTLPTCHEPIKTSYVWGPFPVLPEQPVNDIISDDVDVLAIPQAEIDPNAIQSVTQIDIDASAIQTTPQTNIDATVIQTTPQTDIDASAIQTVPQTDIVATAIQTAPQVDIDATADQTVSVEDVDNTPAQDNDDIAVLTDAEKAQASALFTAKIMEFLVDLQLPDQLPCAYPEQLALLKNPFEQPIAEKIIPRVPVNIDGVEWTGLNKPYLLPQSLLTLSELFVDIGRQRDLLPLLHVGWRQEVLFGEDKAPSFRLFAGKNFADKFSASGEQLSLDLGPISDSGDNNYLPEDEIDVDYNDVGDNNYLPEDEIDVSSADIGTQIINEESLFDRINRVLADDSAIRIDEQNDNTSSDLDVQETLSALWELDGKLKVYLQYVGRTPYLHVDTNLEYRSPIFIEDKQVKLENYNQSAAIQSGAIIVEQSNQPNYLQSVQFNQLRRVISKQLHYFDHPLFGMIVHITRYNLPLPELDDPALEESQTDVDAKRVEN